jgi:hypothetical protein
MGRDGEIAVDGYNLLEGLGTCREASRLNDRFLIKLF